MESYITPLPRAFSIILWRFLQVGGSSFAFIAHWCSLVYVTSLFKHSPTGELLGDFQSLAIMTKASVNICVQASV